MKNTFLIILAVIFITICLICTVLISVRAEKNEIIKENAEYERYLNKEVLGTDIASLISRVIDKNERNNIQKDEKNYYIDNGINSIKIDLKMSTIEKTYPMEEIYNNNMTEFVKNFNFIKFRCTSIEYHEKTNKVSKLIFEEIQ